MKNKYRNPWFESCSTPRPEFYENDAPMVFEFRGVQVFKLWNNSFDYVLNGCCITQRHGFTAEAAPRVINDLLDGEQPVCEEVAKHLAENGFSPITYEQYTEQWKAGQRK